jgi:hypothetical protein
MSLPRSIGDPLGGPPALSDADQQLQRLLLDRVIAGLAGVRTLEAADLLSEIDLATGCDEPQ